MWHSNAFYHPKTIHIVREDSSAVALVGSGNFTLQGLGVNVEAGVILERDSQGNLFLTIQSQLSDGTASRNP